MADSFKWVLALFTGYLFSKSVFSFEGPIFQNSNSFSPRNQVKRCCCKSTTPNDCIRTLNITWDLLKQYRTPMSASSNAPKLSNFKENNLIVGIAGRQICKNEEVLRYSLPKWNKLDLNANHIFSSYFSPDGYLQVNEYAYSPEEYCIESINPYSITILACSYTSYCTKEANDKFNVKKVCLFRCCGYGEVWDISGERLRCANSGVHKWKPEIYSDTRSNKVVSFNRSESEFVILTSHPRTLVKNCKADYTFQISTTNVPNGTIFKWNKYGTLPFRVLPDGTVWIKIRKFNWIKLHPGEYCIDGFQYGKGKYLKDGISGSLLFECKLYESDEKNSISFAHNFNLRADTLLHILLFVESLHLFILL